MYKYLNIDLLTYILMLNSRPLMHTLNYAGNFKSFHEDKTYK